MVLDIGPCYSSSSLKFSIINIWKLFRNSLRAQSRSTESKSAFNTMTRWFLCTKVWVACTLPLQCDYRWLPTRDNAVAPWHLLDNWFRTPIPPQPHPTDTKIYDYCIPYIKWHSICIQAMVSAMDFSFFPFVLYLAASGLSCCTPEMIPCIMQNVLLQDMDSLELLTSQVL